MNPYWDDDQAIPRVAGVPVRVHHRPKPLYDPDYGRLIGYVCDCCDTIYTPNMRPTGPRLSNMPPVTNPYEWSLVHAHQASHRPPVFHHFIPDQGRENRKHAARVAARSRT